VARRTLNLREENPKRHNENVEKEENTFKSNVTFTSSTATND
jgi:hypothetical protein